MLHRYRLLTSVGCLVGIATIQSSPALAQGSEQAAQTGEDAATLEEIVVTAQKRSERLQDVPISISVVGAEMLNSTGAKNLTELQGVVPGVFFSGNAIGGSAPISIRGTAGVNTYLLDDPVAVYVNGVYQSSGTFGGTGFLDVGSIEVVRGPQGTLQGRNATAGAVLVTTAEPTSSLSGFVRASIADPFEVRGEAALGGPLSDTLQVRLAGNIYHERGWAKNLFNGSHIGGGHGYGFRATLKWEPSDRLGVRVYGGRTSTYAEPATARYARTTFNPDPAGALTPVATVTPTAPLTPAELDSLENGNQFNLNRLGWTRITDSSLALHMNYDLGSAEVVSVTGYNHITNHSLNESDGIATTDREGFSTGSVPTRNFSEELRLQSTGSPRLSYILGLYYSYSDQDMEFFINNLKVTQLTRTAFRAEAHQKTNSYAGFADATFRLTDELSVIGGIRYTRETKDFDLFRSILNFDTRAVLVPLPAFLPPLATFKNTSYRAKVIYKPSRDIMMYASYSTGFKSGGFNAFGTDVKLRPETLESWEGGVKASLFDRRVDFAVSAYTNRYNDLHIRYGVPSGGVAIANAADSKIKGFEVEASARPIENLRLSATLAYTDAKFTDFATNSFDLLNRLTDATGNKLPRTPKWQYSVQANYSPQISEKISGVFQASFNYRTKIYLYHTDQNSDSVIGKGVGELGLRAGLTFEPQQLTATVFATNLNNGRSANGFNIAYYYPVVTYNKPRSIGFQIEKKF